MRVKSPITLTDQQEAFARSLESSGQDSGVGSVLQEGLKALRLKAEDETFQTQGFGEFLEHRLKGPVVSTTEMRKPIDAMIERKRLSLSNQLPPQAVEMDTSAFAYFHEILRSMTDNSASGVDNSVGCRV